MAYSVDDIGSVGAWTASDYDADDIALDEDNTVCMTNGTEGDECDEYKEGVLNCRVEINVAPADITSLKVRFYCTTAKTPGIQTLLPYTDVNSVSNTNEVVETYDTDGVWVEHICDANFIAELGDVSGKCYVRLASGENGSSSTGKSKLGEVQAEVITQTWDVEGFVLDNDGDPLSGKVVQAHKVITTSPFTFNSTPADSDTSAAVTGAYSLVLTEGDFVLICFDEATPNKMDISERITVGP